MKRLILALVILVGVAVPADACDFRVASFRSSRVAFVATPFVPTIQFQAAFAVTRPAFVIQQQRTIVIERFRSRPFVQLNIGRGF